MIDANKVSLSRFRLDQAKECLLAADANLSISLKTSANRSYYCIFHSIRAVLALDGFDSKKHSGVISEFRRKYVKTGIFDPAMSNMIKQTFTTRNESDYEDFYVVSKEEAMKQTENARDFLETCERYIEGFLEANT